MTPHQRRTITMGTASSDWTFGRHVVRDFFALESPVADGAVRCLGDIAKGRVVAVTDENVERLHGSELPSDIPRIVVQPGEPSKSLGSLAEVLRLMVDAGLDRSGTVVAFGGGVVGDLAGFAASVFMRGVQWVNVPTTLLAMVDASIGGKTGVDVDGVKNLAGAFHPPAAIVADPAVLGTLPAEERAAGMAEAIKEAIIGSRLLFERIEGGTFDDGVDIAVAAHVKMEIVHRDPFERGERALLNLGHTVGHGIESASGFDLTHGEAVAVGLVAEARIAELVALAPTGFCDRIKTALGRLGLPTRTGAPASSVRAAMASDKKRESGRLKFALPRDIADVVYGVEVEEAVLMEALGEVCRGE